MIPAGISVHDTGIDVIGQLAYDCELAGAARCQFVRFQPGRPDGPPATVARDPPDPDRPKRRVRVEGHVAARDVLELRGDTHLVLLPGDEPASGEAYFDLMVEDIDVTHAQLDERGLSPSAIAPGSIHRSFTVESPSGHTIKFNSTHVSDQPV